MLKKISKNLSKIILASTFVVGLVSISATIYETYMYDYIGASVVKLTKTSAGRSGGTGFQIRTKSGKYYILTNKHICNIGDVLYATPQGKPSIKVKVIKKYDSHDLCLMEPYKGLRPLDIASSISLHERIWLIGHPALRPLTLESGHYAGNMFINLWGKCGKVYNKKLPNPKNLFEIMMNSQFCYKRTYTQYINNIAYGGNSGSPVVNKFGNVIGVLFAGRPDQPTASYTVPLNKIISFLKDK